MCAEDIDDLITVVFGEVNFSAEAEAFLGGENGGEELAFFKYAE